MASFFCINKSILTITLFIFLGLKHLCAWSDLEVKNELDRNQTEIQVFQQIGIKKLPLSLAMAKWASQKARKTADIAEQKKYASLAREILNEARYFGWDNRAPTSLEGQCMASTSVDVALASDDSASKLWDGTPKSEKHKDHYNYLSRIANAARYVASKIDKLTQAGSITWARLTGVRNSLVDALEIEKPENIKQFLTPNPNLVTLGTTHGINWHQASVPDTWEITADGKELLEIADTVIRSKNHKWPIRDFAPATLKDVRQAYAELNRLGVSVKTDLESPCDFSAAASLGYSPLKITKLISLFLLLDPKNYQPQINQDGFGNADFTLANMRIESSMYEWTQKASKADFSNDLATTTALLDQMDPIIKKGGLGSQGVHALDAFQKANTKNMLEMGRKYFGGHYTKRTTKAELIDAINKRLTALGANLTAHYDGSNLSSLEIMTHLGYVLNGYPTEFKGTLESESTADKITEAEWIEILSMIFDFSQKLDAFCLNTGIDSTPFNLESTFYSQIFENQFTGGGCVPGRKNRILYRLANLLRQWMTFGYRLA